MSTAPDLDADPRALTGYGFARGDYYCLCCYCSEQFVGDKRAVACESCARERWAEGVRLRKSSAGSAK